MIVKPGTFRLKRSLNNQVARIFANGLDGFWYDPLLPYLTKISDGTQPVTAAEDTIGRWIDRSGRNNHGIQATAAARPTYRLDAAGLPYAAWLGTDDSLTSATGGGGSAGFFFCAAIRPTGGAGTTRYIFDDQTALSGYRINLGVGNILAFRAGNGSAENLAATTNTVDVGTAYVLTCWDDGVNLNAQVNNGTIASTARPVVAAGTAGFTLGKANVVAGGYLIADVYHMAYAKDTGLTAAQRRSEQLLAASRIGITL